MRVKRGDANEQRGLESYARCDVPLTGRTPSTTTPNRPFAIFLSMCSIVQKTASYEALSTLAPPLPDRGRRQHLCDPFIRRLSGCLLSGRIEANSQFIRRTALSIDCRRT